MSERRSQSARTSAAIVEYLLAEKSLSQEQLAELLDVSASFISRVRSQQRAFTLDHLQTIEQQFNMPLGALFLATMRKSPTNPQLAKARELAMKALDAGDQAAASLRSRRAALASAR